MFPRTTTFAGHTEAMPTSNVAVLETRENAPSWLDCLCIVHDAEKCWDALPRKNIDISQLEMCQTCSNLLCQEVCPTLQKNTPIHEVIMFPVEILSSTHQGSWLRQPC